MRFFIAGMILVCSSIQDIKKRSLSNRGLVFGGIVAVVWCLLEWVYSGWIAGNCLDISRFPWERLAGVVPGTGLLVLSWTMKGQVGCGDAWLMCIIGILLGVGQSVSILFYALLVAGSVSLVLLVFRKVKRDTKLPFVPFLFGGYLLSLMQQFA